LRAAFPAQLAGVRAADLVFVDESGVNLAMTRTYARSLRGTRAFGSAPRNWGDNVSILSALSLRGPLASMYLPGATNGPVFPTYLKQVLVPKLWQGAVVVMDNLGAHKVKGVQSLLESAGARLLYLPPYSPDFNPIEMAWSKFKNHLRTVAARTRRTLAQAIRAGLATITPDDACGFFRHCGYRS
jgi:transposase